MTLRSLGCPACAQLTSGDCGQHGPLVCGTPFFVAKVAEDATADLLQQIARVKSSLLQADATNRLLAQRVIALTTENERLKQGKA